MALQVERVGIVSAMTNLMNPEYVAVVASSWPAALVLDYMADFCNAAEWDPSVEKAVRAEGGDGGAAPPVQVGRAFDLTVRVGRRVARLHYVITGLTANSVQLTARTSSLESVDTVTVTPRGTGGSIMEYNARLTFRGLARIANPLLARSLRKLGDNAAASLNQRLNS